MSKPRRPLRRDLNGVLLLDKPTGVSSNDAMMQARHLFNAEKAGHTGTLDPMATGLLPICFGQATKLSAHLLDARKRYLATVKLGEATNTGDADGEVMARSDPSGLSPDALHAAAKALTGEIRQVPPMYSEIKRDGVRLYELARGGVEVEREPRTVQIHALKVAGFDGDIATLEVTCSKGTYVRTLAEDWAKQFGQSAHLVALRRLGVGLFGAEAPVAMVTLAELRATSDLASLNRHLLPARSAVADWASVNVTADQAAAMTRGRAVPFAANSGWVVIDHVDGGFLGLGEVLPEGLLQPRRWFGEKGI